MVPAALLLALAPVAAAAQPMEPWSGWMWWGPMHMIFPLLFFCLAVWVIVSLLRHVDAQNDRNRGTSRALELLDERYAKGEIDRDEYMKRRDDIRGT